MKSLLRVSGMIGLAAVASTSSAQDNAGGNNDPRRESPGAAAIAEPVPHELNRFGLSARLGYNIKASFQQTGFQGFPQTNPGSPTGHGEDRSYDDGYVRVDSSGGAQNLTWYYGYAEQAQLNGDNLLMHSTSAPGNISSSGASDSPQVGVELSYARELGKLGPGHWGIEAAFGYTDLKISDSRGLSSSVSRTTDSYPLGGVIPFDAPYAGTFAGPGPLIPDAPVDAFGNTTRTVSSVPASITGNQSIATDFYGFRFGPYYELPLCQRVTIAISGGFAFAVVDGSFRYQEMLTVAGLNPLSQTGQASSTEVLCGGYAAAQINVKLARSLDWFTGVQYQNLGQYSVTAGNQSATLDLRSAVFWTLGFNYRF